MAEKTDPGYWAVLPAPVRYDAKLPAAAKILYAEISALTQARGYCFATNEYFLTLYGITERTLQRHLKTLEEHGYIRILDGEGGVGRRRIFAGNNPLLPNPVKIDGVTPSILSPNPVKNVAQNNINNKQTNNPPKAPQGAGVDFEPKKTTDWKPDRFESFWRYYPLHKSKQAAMRAWDRLKPSDELLAVIGKALKRQIAEKRAECERHGQSFEWKLHASTYLNNARWTDEAEAAAEPRARSPLSEKEEIEWV